MVFIEFFFWPRHGFIDRIKEIDIQTFKVVCIDFIIN